MPYSLNSRQQNIEEDGYYACIFCGFTEKLKPAPKYACPKCQKDKWVKASNKKRIR
jgi:rubrerythrin